MSDLRPLQSMLSYPTIAEGAMFEMAIDPDDLGIKPIDEDNIALYHDLVSHLELPALRTFTAKGDREEAGFLLDKARQEFGNRGFLLKAALLGSAAAKAYLESENFVMAEAQMQGAIYLDINAGESVRRSKCLTYGQPIRANFPDLADPISPKTSIADSTSYETMYTILKSHLCQRAQVVAATFNDTSVKLSHDSNDMLQDARKNRRGDTVIEDKSSIFTRPIILNFFARNVDTRY